MSEYENVVVGKLRLKGKPLDVKAGGCTKKKKHKRNFEHIFSGNHHSDLIDKTYGVNNGNEAGGQYDERLTAAERRYLEQWKHVEVKRLLKSAEESHRDRIEKFNQYLANLSEHYDIPKVGPG
ncbi:uncharacterized protein LOC130804347 [Amaranthus tricolor]|uniref:uncharacterized protein LOC130804347 n=1 Tax=Amaranthus tricolor TaxID=29722 RepID=UPI0025907E37|nr:uncharacterized protein LOC130804347 [Amaranthus tricolor]